MSRCIPCWPVLAAIAQHPTLGACLILYGIWCTTNTHMPPPCSLFPRFLQEFVSGISVLIRGSLVDKLECESSHAEGFRLHTCVRISEHPNVETSQCGATLSRFALAIYACLHTKPLVWWVNAIYHPYSPILTHNAKCPSTLLRSLRPAAASSCPAYFRLGRHGAAGEGGDDAVHVVDEQHTIVLWGQAPHRRRRHRHHRCGALCVCVYVMLMEG